MRAWVYGLRVLGCMSFYEGSISVEGVSSMV